MTSLRLVTRYALDLRLLLGEMASKIRGRAVLGRDDGLFVSDDGKTALIFGEVGAPTLCFVGGQT